MFQNNQKKNIKQYLIMNNNCLVCLKIINFIKILHQRIKISLFKIFRILKIFQPQVNYTYLKFNGTNF